MDNNRCLFLLRGFKVVLSADMSLLLVLKTIKKNLYN